MVPSMVEGTPHGKPGLFLLPRGHRGTRLGNTGARAADGSVVKSICRFGKGSGFNSQYLHGYSQSSLLQFQGIRSPLLASKGAGMKVVHRHTCKHLIPIK